MGRALPGQLRHYSHPRCYHRTIFWILPPEIRTGFYLLALTPGGPLALQFAASPKVTAHCCGTLISFLPVGNLDHPGLVLLFFPKAGRGIALRDDDHDADAPHCHACGHWTSVAKTDSRARAQARIVVGQAIHRDLHHRSGDGREV